MGSKGLSKGPQAQVKQLAHATLTEREELRARLKEIQDRVRPEWQQMRKQHLAELTESVKTMSPDELIEAHARYIGAHDVESEDVVRDEIVRLIELGRKADGNQVVTEARGEPES